MQEKHNDVHHKIACNSDKDRKKLSNLQNE